jgi:molybdenum cofactor biosynthesis enzyme MoaA
MRDPTRSAVPDLLFEEEQVERLADLGPLVDAPLGVSAQTPLHRVTVFLTYRCNLDCPYCKTIARSEAELEARPQKRRSYDLSSFSTLLASLGDTPVRHLHFTGGEASLVTGLDEMIGRAKRAGVERVSLTTNGTLAPARYLELVKAGLDELRVSIDAEEPALGATLTGRRDVWAKAVETLSVLGAARRDGAPFFLIVNTVIGLANRRRLAALVEFFLGFGVDDVKLITEVDVRDELGDFDEAGALKAQVRALLERLPAERFPLLKRKLETVFSRTAIGLDDAPRRADWRCYVPLTERTVDGEFYYPCSVYLREGGAPLGRLSEPQDVQREKSARFVLAGCGSDALCQRWCLHCTRSWNDRVNAARKELDATGARPGENAGASDRVNAARREASETRAPPTTQLAERADAPNRMNAAQRTGPEVDR